MKKTYHLLLLLLIFFTLDCSSSLEKDQIMVGKIPVTVEIADNTETRARGLMKRNSLEKNAGMLFVFQEEKKLSFWMKDTTIPLSIAYISKNGEIKEIYNMKPLDETAIRSTRSVMYALEMNQGWFESNGIKEGDRITLP